MPIRFRCRFCNRTLGIARRKAGTQIDCPQCRSILTVPDRDDPPETTPAPLPDWAVGQVASAAPAVAPKPPPLPAASARPQPKRRPGEDPPLFEGDDFDALLGLDPKNGPKLNLDDAPPRKPPVGGTEALSLDDAPPLTLTPQKATLLVVAVVVLLGIAFVAGFLIASRS